MYRFSVSFVILLLCQFTIPAVAQDNSSEPETFSRANTLLFLTAHLDNVETPATLNYAFGKTGKLEENFSDIVQVNLNAERDATFQYFTDERASRFPDVPKASGNPVLLLILHRDVQEMERLTGGNWRYFQKQMKIAFEENATVEPVEFEFNNQKLKGEQITIHPYIQASHKDKMKEYADVMYSFILSDDIPGMLYQASYTLQDVEKDNAPLLQETLTFTASK